MDDLSRNVKENCAIKAEGVLSVAMSYVRIGTGLFGGRGKAVSGRVSSRVAVVGLG